jgi:hypothetical protein
VHQYTSLVLRSLPNNHEQHPQLSSDAPDEPLESGHEKGPDLAVVRSKLSQWKPPTEAADGEVEVAVGCADEAFVSPAEGFQLLEDRTLLTPVNMNTDDNGVVSSVRYRLAPGVHTLTFRAPDCKVETRDVTVRRGETVRVRGVLTNAVPEPTPFGKLDHGYIGIEPVLALGLVDLDGFDELRVDGAIYRGSTTTTGLRLSFGFVSSYFEAGLSIAGMYGRHVTREVISSGVTETAMARWQGAPRVTLGLRVPYEGFALRPLVLSVGVINDIMLHYHGDELLHLSDRAVLQIAAGFGVDFSLSCDVALRPLAQGVHDSEYRIGMELGVGIAYMPSTACARDRTARRGLEVR